MSCFEEILILTMEKDANSSQFFTLGEGIVIPFSSKTKGTFWDCFDWFSVTYFGLFVQTEGLWES
jgi:hypothetical protein